MITVGDVEAEVQIINDIRGDDEAAHSREDRLRQEVLEAIAEGSEDAQDLATAVLKTSEIKFTRWCA